LEKDSVRRIEEVKTYKNAECQARVERIKTAIEEHIELLTTQNWGKEAWLTWWQEFKGK
jgi:hypothetical protein